MTLAPGLQVKDPSKRPKSSLEPHLMSLGIMLLVLCLPYGQTASVFGASRAGEDKGWRKITKRCKDVLIGRGPKIRKNTQGKEQKVTVIEQLAVSNSTILNRELNWGSTDWNREAELIKSLLSQTNICND